MYTAAKPALSRSLLAAAHMAVEITSSMISRPISFGNSTYIDECLESLRAIQREVLLSAGSPADPGANLVVETLAHFLTTPSVPTAQWLVGFLGSIDGAMPGRDETSYKKMSAAVLPAKRYRRILVMTGPGIGVGDEIALFPFVACLHAKFPSATFEIYSFFPGIWRALMPGLRTRNLVGRPLRAYQQIESCTALGIAHELLIIFANFAGQKMFLPYFQPRCPADLLEIAVGRGTVWWIPGDGAQAARHCALDPVVPNQSRALEDLLTHLLGRHRRAGALLPAPSKAGRKNSPASKFQVLVNPLTSKRIPLQPEDWAKYILTLRRALPRERALDCRVYPGLASPASEFAAKVVQLCHERGVLAARDRIGLLTSPDGAPLDSATAIRSVHQMIANADLLLGLDTFTAHLAAYTQTPSLTLCLTHNPEFWEEEVNTLWVDLSAGDGSIHSLIRLVIEIAAGEGDTCSGFDRERCRRLMVLGPPRNLVTSLLDLFEEPYRCWLSAVDAVWDTLPQSLQKLLASVDAGFAWPILRQLFHDRAAPVQEVKRALAKVGSSAFFRLSCLAGLRSAA